MEETLTHNLETLAADDVYVLPASLSQQRFWTLYQLDPTNTSLNMPLALRLTGRLDYAVLHRSCNAMIARHEVLRTTFSVVEGVLQQVVAPATEQALPLEDLSALEPALRETRMDEWLQREAQTPLSLEQGPLIILRLLRLGVEEHILLITMQHSVCDGWSNGIVVREIGEFYAAFSQNGTPDLPELALQYADFAAWQHEWLDSEAAQTDLAYWHDLLRTPLPVLDLPLDRPRSPLHNAPGGLATRLLPPLLMRELQTLCRDENVTLFMLFLAVFQTLLFRASGQTDVVTLSAAANRNQVELEPLIGPFSNNLILRTALADNLTFRDLLSRVRESMLAGFAHAALPFETVMDVLPPASARGLTPLFQTHFLYQRAFMQNIELPELTITPLRSVSPGSTFDLACAVLERTEGARIQLEYNAALFEAFTMAALLGNFERVLAAVVKTPDVRLADIALPDSVWTRRAGGETPLPSPAMPVALTAPYAAPRRPAEVLLRDIWRGLLRVTDIGIHDDFFAMGGHSLLAVRLFAQIESAFGKKLPLSALFGARTIAAMAALLERDTSAWPALVAIQPHGTRPPLFCLHRNDGLVLCYETLAQRLGNDQPVFGLQAECLDHPPTRTVGIPDMAARFLAEIRSFYPSGPYLLAGSSFGGILAFEIACQLRAQGQTVGLLALLDTFAPLAFQRKLFAMPAAGRLPAHWDALRERGVKGKLEYMVSGVRRRATLALHGTDVELDGNLGHHLPETLRAIQEANEQAVLNYTPGHYPDPMIMFRAHDRNQFSYDDPRLWWGDLLPRMEVFEVPGDHLAMLKEPHVGTLAGELSRRLQAVPVRP